MISEIQKDNVTKHLRKTLRKILNDKTGTVIKKEDNCAKDKQRLCQTVFV